MQYKVKDIAFYTEIKYNFWNVKITDTYINDITE